MPATRLASIDQSSDPFGEHRACPFRRNATLLGALIEFATDSKDLDTLAAHAFAHLPPQRFAPAMRLSIAMRLQQNASAPKARQPPAPVLQSAGSLLSASLGEFGFAVLSPRHRSALLSVNPAFLNHPYQLRYELMEFAVYTLAARAQSLVPLHGACIGRKNRGALILGDSGAGKSTLAMLSLYQGFDFLAEDAVFIEPRTLRATGLANFLHVRHDSTRWLKTSERKQVRRAPEIERRSGVRKFELDLRQRPFRLAPRPLKVAALVFLSAQPAKGQLIRPLSGPAGRKRLLREQAYGAMQPQWKQFERQLRRVPAFEVRRGRHPCESLEAIATLLD